MSATQVTAQFATANFYASAANAQAQEFITA